MKLQKSSRRSNSFKTFCELIIGLELARTLRKFVVYANGADNIMYQISATLGCSLCGFNATTT